MNFAKEELFRRDTKDIWENSNVTLQDLLKFSDQQKIETSLKKYYPEVKSSIEEYREVFKKLVNYNIENVDNNNIILDIIKVRKRSNILDNKDWYAIGNKKETNEKIRVEFFEWKEWLKFGVENVQIQQIGIDNYIAICLKTMTLISFDEDVIIEKKRIFENQIEGEIFNKDNISNNEDSIDEYKINDVELISYYDSFKDEKEIELNQVRPWIRWFARTIDIYIWSQIVAILILNIPIVLDLKINRAIYAEIIGISSYFIWLFIEAWLISKFGYTLGKWLLEVKIRNNNNEKLTYTEAFSRSLNVWLYGNCANIKILSLVFNVFSYQKLVENGITSWDEKGDFIVTHNKVNIYKALISIFILLILPIIVYYTNKNLFII